MIDAGPYEARLRKRLEVLGKRMRAVEDRLDDRPDPDVEERSVEREDDEMLDHLGSDAQAETRQIEAALARIANGTFGICVACSAPVSEKRLYVIPFAARCRNCAT